MPRKKKPPVPEANRSPKGPGSDPDVTMNDPLSEGFENENVEQTGDRGNIRQNTSNQQDKR